MGNCLKTQLKEIVDNNNLKKFKVLEIGFPQIENPVANQRRLVFSVTEPMTISVSGGTFMDSTLTTPAGTTKEVNANEDTTVYISNTNAVLTIPNKYAIKSMNNDFNDYKTMYNTFALEDLEYSALNTLILSRDAGVTGSLDIVNSISTFDYARISLCENVEIDIEKINNSHITRFIVGGNNVKGNIENCSILNNTLTYFNLDFTSNVTGDINNVSFPVSLISISFNGNTKINGALETFASNMAENRTSGTLTFNADNGSKIRYNGAAFSTKTIRFGSSMISPSAEETAQGWQIA